MQKKLMDGVKKEEILLLPWIALIFDFDGEHESSEKSTSLLDFHKDIYLASIILVQSRSNLRMRIKKRKQRRTPCVYLNI